MPPPEEQHDDEYYLREIYGYQEILVLTESPKDLYDRLRAEEMLVGPLAVTEEQRDVLKWARQRYEEWRHKQTPQPARIPPHKPKPPGATPAPKAAPKPGQDTPQTLGASDTPPSNQVGQGSLPQPLTPAAANQSVWGQNNPVSPQEAASRLDPPPPDPAAQKAAEERLRRNEPEDGEPHPSHDEPRPRRGSESGDPVDMPTGDFVLNGVDIEVRSPYLPIRLIRQYRSGRPYFGPFGFGWDHGYNAYLRALNDGDMALWTGELSEVRLRLTATRWQAAGLAAVLERATLPGDVFLLRQRGGMVWRFEQPAGWPTAARIPLVAIADRHGNRLTLAYDAQGRLASVLDEQERGLHFTYGSCGLLERVSDHTGDRWVAYEHHPEIEHLVQVRWPPTAEFPGGPSATYFYAVPCGLEAVRHNIVRVLDAYGNISVENEYAGPETGWSFNRVIRQQVGDFEWRYAYEQIQYIWPDPVNVAIPASRTLVYAPDLALHVHTFNYRGDLLDHRFRLSADGSLRVVATQRRYDAEGNLVEEIAPDAGRTLYRFDTANADSRARRNLLQVERAAPLPFLQPSRILERTEYDPVFQLPVRQFDEENRATLFVYDFDVGAPNSTGRLVRRERPKSTLADGTTQQSIVRFEHNSRGQLTAMVAAGGARCELDYYGPGLDEGRLMRLREDVAGIAASTELAYDAAGFPARITSPGGGASEVRRNTQGQIEELTPPVIGAPPAARRQWFNDAGKVVRIERPRGGYIDPTLADPFIVDEFGYDVQGRMVGSRNAANTSKARERRMLLDHAGRVIREWDALGQRTDRRFDERGLLLSETRAVGTPESATRRWRYDMAGRQVLFVDAVGRETHIEHDPWGRVRKVHSPSSAVETIVWGPGDLRQERQVEGPPGPGEPPRLLAWESDDYDEVGRLRRHTQWSFDEDPALAIALVTQLTYDFDDNVVALASPRGALTRYVYDGLGRRTAQEDTFGNRLILDYDTAGQIARITRIDVEGAALRQRHTDYRYDARLRLTRIDAPDDSTEMDYDERDLMTERREPGGVTVRFERSANGEITATTIDPGAIRNVWRYDAEGRLAAYVDPIGDVTTWSRDPLGRPARITLPDGASVARRFDAEGRIIEQTQPSGARLAFAYGVENEPARMSGSSAPGVEAVPLHQFGYDGLGRLVRAENPGGVVTRRYDSLGRLRAETTQGAVLAFTHDDAAGTRDLRYPDGRIERTRLDPAGRPAEVVLVQPGGLGGAPGVSLIALDYVGPDRPRRYHFGNGVSSAFAYDDAARLIRAEVSLGGTALDSFRIRYDGRGRRALTQVTGVPDRPVLHLFDAGDRLREARQGLTLASLTDEPDPAAQVAAMPAATAAATRIESYDVDAADTRRAITVQAAGSAPSTLAYTVGPGGRIDAVGGQPIDHHPDGPRRADAGLSYAIDALGRIVKIRDAVGSVRLEMAYDALSRPASGTELGESFHRWFVGARWVHEIRGTAGIVRQASPHPLESLPFSLRGPAGAAFLHADGGQSSLCVTDATGALVQRHRHGPFGVPEAFGPTGAAVPVVQVVGLAWRGMSLRPSIGLYESRSRLYDPALGAFLARDPFLYADSPSPYVFAGHDPVDFSDPSGRNKRPLGEMSWIQTPEDTPEDKAKRKLLLNEPPDGFRLMIGDPSEYLYAMLYGIKKEYYKPIKAQILDERPKYLDANQNVQTVPWKPDRSPQLAVAWGNIAIIPLTSEKFMAQVSVETMLESRAGNIWGHLTYHEGFGAYPATYKSSIALVRGPIPGEGEITIITTNNPKAHMMLEDAIANGRIVLEPGERLGTFRWASSKGMHSEKSGILTHQDLGGTEGYVWTHPDCCWECEAWIDLSAPGYTHLNPPGLWRLERAARQFRF